MSGVLQRLAMRVLPAPGGVRPRLGGRFEGFSGPVEPDFADLHSQPAAPVRRAPAAPEPMPIPAAREAGTGRPAEAAIAPRLLPIGGDEPAAAATGLPPASAPAPTPAPTSAPLVRAAADEHRDAFAGAVPPASAPAPTPAPLVPVAAGEPRNAFPGAAPARAAASSGAAPPAASRDAPGAAQARPDALLLPPGPMAAISTPAKPHEGRHESRHQQAAAPPDIQVSIGRIEIRADREDRPPPRRAPPRPSLMSLEDYLGKGRAGR